MNRSSFVKKLMYAAVLAMAFLPQLASACAVCYGKSDSKLAEGFNWGVLSLLFVVFFVLGSFVVFFIYLARRSAAMAQHGLAAMAEANQKLS